MSAPWTQPTWIEAAPLGPVLRDFLGLSQATDLRFAMSKWHNRHSLEDVTQIWKPIKTISAKSTILPGLALKKCFLQETTQHRVFDWAVFASRDVAELGQTERWRICSPQNFIPQLCGLYKGYDIYIYIRIYIYVYMYGLYFSNSLYIPFWPDVPVCLLTPK